MNDPYHALGLRGNPFRIDPAPGVIEALFLERPFPPIPVSRQRRFIQVIGPKGAGKTTLLLHWRRSAPGPYRHVPPTALRFFPLPVASLVYWDEADRIPAGILYSALAASRLRSATVVAGTHEDLRGIASRFGFEVETFYLPVIRPEEVMQWAAVRINEDSLASGSSGLSLESDEARRIARDAGRSWRRVGALLHRWAAERVTSLSPQGL